MHVVDLPELPLRISTGLIKLLYNQSMLDEIAQHASINDTTPEAEAVLIDLVRRTPPHVRLQLAINASSRVANQCKEAIRRNNPEISEQEIGLRFIEINYGEELANDVRAWLLQRDG
jgi:hypothetical protein